MRIIIEIEDGAVRAVERQETRQAEAANAGGPPAELLQLLGARPRASLQAIEGAAVNVGGPPEELLRALAAPRAGRAAAVATPAQLVPRAV